MLAVSLLRRKIVPVAWLVLTILVTPAVQASIIQTNSGTGDGTVPGEAFDATGNILATSVVSATYSGTFYRQDSGYLVDLSRLSDGILGSLGSAGLGGDGRYTVMPNVATIQFDLDAPYDITSIRSYASWDSGRDGQAYTVSYATAANPSSYTSLVNVTYFEVTDFPMQESFDWETFEPILVPDESTATTLVELASTTGVLAEDVVSLRFIFGGQENGGTAFREFQVTAVPEPATIVIAAAGLAYAARVVRRRYADRGQRS
jgi:hypothetical protein